MSAILDAAISWSAQQRVEALVGFIGLWSAVYGLVEVALASKKFSFDFKVSPAITVPAIANLLHRIE